MATSARVGLGLAVAASASATLALADGPGRLTTYAGASGLAAVLTVAVGAALGVAGLVTSLGAASQRLGDLTLLAALVWFAPVWVGWAQGPPLVRSIGMVAAGFLLPLITHVVLAFPGGRVPTLAARAVVATAYVERRSSPRARRCSGSVLRPVLLGQLHRQRVPRAVVPGRARAIVVTDQWFAVGVAAPWPRCASGGW